MYVFINFVVSSSGDLRLLNFNSTRSLIQLIKWHTTIGIRSGSVGSSPKCRRKDLQEILLYTRQTCQPGKKEQLTEIKRKPMSNPISHASCYHLQAWARQESQAVMYAIKGITSRQLNWSFLEIAVPAAWWQQIPPYVEPSKQSPRDCNVSNPAHRQHASVVNVNSEI